MLFIENLKKKLKEEEGVSGIEIDMSDVEKVLEEVLEKEVDVENFVEMWNRVMESMCYMV